MWCSEAKAILDKKANGKPATDAAPTYRPTASTDPRIQRRELQALEPPAMSTSPASRHPRFPTPSLPSPASPCPPPVGLPAFLQTDDMRKYLKEQIREHTKRYVKATRENISLEIAAGLDRLRRDIAHAKEAWSTMPTESVSQGASERVQKQVGERGDALRRLEKEVGGLKSSFVHTVDDFGTSLESFRSSLDSHRSTVSSISSMCLSLG